MELLGIFIYCAKEGAIIMILCSGTVALLTASFAWMTWAVLALYNGRVG